MLRLTVVLSSVVLVVAACADQTNATPTLPESEAPAPAEEVADAGTTSDAAAEASARPTFTGKCADTFGDGLTDGFGRIDGYVYAVQKPTDSGCVFPNSDHLILQVWMKGAVYRMVVNVLSDRAGQDPRVSSLLKTHAPVAPAFEEGWHTGVALDYPSSLGVSSTEFAPLEMNDLVDAIAKELVIGDPVSVYAESGPGRPESAHKVHRNGASGDGAIVLDPTAASPRYYLFRFSDQTF